MMRRYQSTASQFSQPDPYDGSYDLSNPQSFNRYAYVQNDPVNFVDPSGLMMSTGCTADQDMSACYGSGGGGIFWGAGYSSGNGWGNTPRPGLNIIGPNFYSDIRELWRVVDQDLYDHTSGELGSERIPSASLLSPGGPMWLGNWPTPTRSGSVQGPKRFLEAAVRCSRVPGVYMAHEVTTLLKQQAFNGALALGVLGGRFFLLHGATGSLAAGTLGEIGGTAFAKMDSTLRGTGMLGVSAGVAARYYPGLVKESFNNKRDGLRAIRNCLD